MLPHDRPLFEAEFVAFDLETTGLFPVVNRIVEFGVVRFALDGRELGTWEQLVDLECPIPPEVTCRGWRVGGSPNAPRVQNSARCSGDCFVKRNPAVS